MPSSSSSNVGRITTHEQERVRFNPSTLHEKMLVEAESIVQHNWLDVVVHDKQRLDALPVGHVAYWIVGSLGSYLTAGYCDLSARARWTRSKESTVAPIQLLFVRWHAQTLRLRGSQAWCNLHHPAQDRRCYLVIKTDLVGGGELIPVSYPELAALALYDHVTIRPPAT